jgi:hypothetical protein
METCTSTTNSAAHAIQQIDLCVKGACPHLAAHVSVIPCKPTFGVVITAACNGVIGFALLHHDSDTHLQMKVAYFSVHI